MIVAHVRSERTSDDVVLIDRRTKWGNPYVIGKHGNREQVIEQYRQRLWVQLQDQEFRTEFWETFGPADELLCWCAPLPCHGDVIAKAVEWLRVQHL